MFKLLAILFTVFTLTFGSQGCVTPDTTETSVSTAQMEDKKVEVLEWCDNILSQKGAILTQVQSSPSKSMKFLKNMQTTPPKSFTEQYPELSEVVSNITLAGQQLQLFIEEDDAKYYTQGVDSLNRAEKIFNSIK